MLLTFFGRRALKTIQTRAQNLRSAGRPRGGVRGGDPEEEVAEGAAKGDGNDEGRLGEEDRGCQGEAVRRFWFVDSDSAIAVNGAIIRP